MSIKYVILGFLSEMPLTGYDLKKKFSDSEIFHWSGNNNQIYRTLSELHQEQFVTIEVQYQESRPPRKIYSVTEAGLAALRGWLSSTRELPQFRSTLMIQLSWADQLTPEELDAQKTAYEAELRVYVLTLREWARRNKDSTANRRFGDALTQRWIAYYESELEWVRALRQEPER